MRYYKLLGSIFACLALISCNQENYLLYESESRLQFGPEPEYIYRTDDHSVWGDTLQSYTFIYLDESVMEDTVWFHLHTMGSLSDEDRPFRLEQIELEGEENAVAGVHYRAFDDPAAAELYVIPKNSAYRHVPIIVKRDASLSGKTVRLRFQLVANEYFQLGDPRFLWREVIISDQYVKPSKWMDAYVGEYGNEKMKFMIQESRLRWDDDCFLNSLNDGSLPYWSIKFKELLQKRNEMAGEKLKENDGREVIFP